MSEWKVEIIRIGAVEKHPNADALSLTKVHGGYPVIFRTGEYREGDLAVYVPVDSVVPSEDPRWAFLGEHRRIRAKRLRGVFSMGLLTPATSSVAEGEDVGGSLGITRYVPPEDVEPGEGDEPDPGFLPVYGIEALRRWPDAVAVGEEVVVTEKLHGENARFVHDGARLWCGSRTRVKADVPGSQWWRAARRYDLAAKLAQSPMVGLYAEVHGYTKGFDYGVAKGEVGLRFFDAVDVKSRRWLDYGEFAALTDALGLPRVPELYRGPWSGDRSLAEGTSALGKHVREGFVVRPVRERYDAAGCGRVVLKLHGEGFLTR